MVPTGPTLSIPLTRPIAIATRHGGFGWGYPTTRPVAVSLNAFWVVDLISEGAGSLWLYGREHAFAPGCAVVAPPDVEHRYSYRGRVRKTHAHFRTAPGAVGAPVPVVQDLGDRFPWFLERIHEGQRIVTAQPERATALLWHMLWQLTCGPAIGAEPLHHPVVRALLVHLAEHLADPIVPAVLARRLGCSPVHLSRLCRAAFGLPLLAYVRHCRLERARHLLADTTRPVSDIAAEVGYPDLQHFNKLVRAAYGLPPSALRRADRPRP